MEASEATATRFLHAIALKFEGLRHFPLSAPARDDLAPGLRSAVHRNYVIFYLADDVTLTVIRVLHGARDLGAIAERGGFIE